MKGQKNKTILVTGATGQQGGAALKHLRERGFPVRALTRDPSKPEARKIENAGIEVVRGDLDDSASISRALEDVYGVYSVQNEKAGAEAEIRAGLNLANVANRAAVDHLVYSSVASADANTGIAHFESKNRIEQHIRNSGIRYTILRPVFFMENLLQVKDQVEQGSFSFPLKPETRLQMVAVTDIGHFVATAFERPGHFAGRAMELAGDELSMNEIAAAFSRKAGREVRYVQMPWDDFEKRMGAEFTAMFRWFETDGYHVDIPSVRAEWPNLLHFDRWLDLEWTGSTTKTSGAGSHSQS